MQKSSENLTVLDPAWVVTLGGSEGAVSSELGKMGHENGGVLTHQNTVVIQKWWI